MDATGTDKGEAALREAIIAAGLWMEAQGINQGTSGNVSCRSGDGILITPTSIPYDRLVPDDLVWLGFDGTRRGRYAPSSEWRFHLEILRTRPEIGAVVHAHPTYCTILAIMGLPIPAVHYMIAAAGGPDIRCSGYATYGTEELKDQAMAALQDRTACLLAHHGMIAMGGSLDRALWLAVEVETLARQYHGCLQIGTPPLLPDDEIERVRIKFKSYGQGAETERDAD